MVFIQHIKVMTIVRINLVPEMFKLIEDMFNWIIHMNESINLIILVIWNVSNDRALRDMREYM